jgi:hypothetical protein
MENTAKYYHMSISVRGALRWIKKDLGKLFINNGKRVSADDAKEYLMDKLKEGYEVIPYGNACEGFDKVNGCPGHVK